MTTLLTEPPGNIIYHLITLFALQAVFAISLGQWLRDRENRDAWRYTWASGGLIFGRILVLAIGLLLAESPEQATIFLPPLEQALNTMTAVILIWALLPPSLSQPRLGDVLLLISLLILNLLTFSFVITWQDLAANGQTYGETTQVTIWLTLQIGIYFIGFLLALKNRFSRKGLEPFILLVLIATAVAALLSQRYGTAVDTHILFWSRLGFFIALPMWAILAYRQSIIPLVAAQQASHPAAQQLVASLTLSAQLLHSANAEVRSQQAILMLEELLDAAFVALGQINSKNQRMMNISSNLPQAENNAPRSWQMELADWAPYRTAVRTKKMIELVPDGKGTRHLHILYEMMQIGPYGAMLVVPMIVDHVPQGVLLLAKTDGRLRWSGREKSIAPPLADFIGQSLVNAQKELAPLPETAVFTPQPEMDPTISGRIIALEAERDKLARDLDTSNNRIQQAESRAVMAMKRAHDLALTLDEMERLNRDEHIEALQREIEDLRAALKEAEEAVAIAAAGEGGLSPEWVMLTITRYSGQLEEAQAHIEKLETELSRRKTGGVDEVLISLIQELRTPMTSIAGFTDLLLGETLGILGTRQRDLLQRVQANTERLGELLAQILQLAISSDQTHLPESEVVDVREALETAVTSIMPQVRDKSLRLDLDIKNNLPDLNINRQEFQQMMTHLLGNAVQASGSNGRVSIAAYTEKVADHNQAAANILNFLQIDISDSGGGIKPDDLPHVFEVRHRADAPLIKGLGDTGAGLSVTNNLAIANGGRIWVDSLLGQGSTFSLLFPLVNHEVGTDDRSKANGSIKEAP